MRAAYAVLFVILLWTGCHSDDDIEAFRARAYALPNGIVETDENGNVQEWPESETDWETSPRYRNIVIVDPAYPNPAQLASPIFIEVRIRFEPVQGGLFVHWIRDGVLLRLSDHPEASSLGDYVLRFDAAGFNDRGLFRIFITDVRGEIVSYGDIRVE